MNNKHLHRLGFKVTNEFLQRNNFNKYSCGDGLISILTLIKSYATDILKKEWMANNVLKLPHTLNSINPASLLLKEDGFEDGFVEFYCHASLSKTELDRISYLLRNSIEEFIETHRKGLEEFNPNVNLENITINPKLQGAVDTKFLSDNLTLVKVLFIRELSKSPIFIGTSKNEKYIQEGREINFYPSYSKQGGHRLISEIIDIEKEGKVERMAYYITPNIEIQDSEIYIYPVIGVKRIISYKKLNAIQYGTAASYSTLVFDGHIYHSPRVAYRANKDTGIKDIQLISDDWKLYKYLEKYKGITFEDIKNHIQGDNKDNIYLIYSNKSGVTHKLSAGVPTCDKLDIYNHLKTSLSGLEPIDPIEELKIKSQNKNKAGSLTSTDRLILANTLYRNDKTELELLVIHPPTSTLYDDIINVIENEKLIERNAGLTIVDHGVYQFETYMKKPIILTLRNIPSIIGLEITSDTETIEERLNKLMADMGEKSPNKLYLAFIDLENMGKYDAKTIIRNALDGYGIINQFINGTVDVSSNKISSGLRDLLNDIGLGNLNQSINDNEIIYTLHKASKINFICRLDNSAVEIKVPGITDSYLHITDIYPILPTLKFKTDKFENLDSLAIATLLQDISDEKRDVILLLEEGETQYNTIISSLDTTLLEKIKSRVKEYITTDLLGHQEVIQMKDDNPSLGTGIYKIKDGVYISIGDKGQDKTTVDACKIRRWVNNHEKISIGATISFKDRIAYEIRVHKNKEQDNICELVHKLRLSLTTHTHLNRCITTDYILGLNKHL